MELMHQNSQVLAGESPHRLLELLEEGAKVAKMRGDPEVASYLEAAKKSAEMLCVRCRLNEGSISVTLKRLGFCSLVEKLLDSIFSNF